MATVFDELRTLLGLPLGTKLAAMAAVCLAEIKNLRDAQNVHTAEIKAWRAENRKLRVSGGEDLMEATKLRAEIQKLRDENQQLRAELAYRHDELVKARIYADQQRSNVVAAEAEIRKWTQLTNARDAQIEELRTKLEAAEIARDEALEDRAFLIRTVDELTQDSIAAYRRKFKRIAKPWSDLDDAQSADT